MSHVVDRRLNGRNKSAVNRQKFIQRYRRQIKQAVDHLVSRRNMTDLENEGEVRIPARDLSEPSFGHGDGGVRESVHPGNVDFVQGDRVKRPDGGGAGGGHGKAGKDGGGEDDFVFELSREEFLDFFFEDMALPNLVKKRLASIQEAHRVRAGFVTDGVPTNIHVVRSLKNALGRRIALGGGARRRLREIDTEIARLAAAAPPDASALAALAEEREALLRRLGAIPWLDPFDLRYHNLVVRHKPATQAVMFCVMDVSGSMDQEKKDLAKRFFLLLYLFLTRAYERIQVVFIRHHTVAEEVDEERFFHQRETGGTLVSTALELTAEVIRERYPAAEWNIYVAQASDGDNMSDDSPYCRELLLNEILPAVQYFAYVEVHGLAPQNLWEEYAKVAGQADNFAMQRIRERSEIYPVLRELFKKQPA